MKNLLPLLVAALSSCHVHLDWDLHDRLGVTVDNSAGPTFLAKHASDDGRVTTYTVSGQTRRFPGSNRDLKAGVVVSTRVTASLPYLGIDVASVDAATAEGLGIEPWIGVLVREVEDEQPAAAAGLKRGDLLLSAGDAEFQSEGEFADFVTRSLLPGDRVTFLVSRSTSEFVRAEVEADVLVGSRSVDETESSRVDLELQPELVRRAGMGVMTVPSDLSGDIWGLDQSTPLVAAVVTGSPAYLAGVRAGDRVLRADGVPVETAEEVLEIASRSDGSLDVELDGRLGKHEARFSL
ncbi:MAG: PDZ domain-containing protein, partial [Planctomycetota bacterium]